MTPQSAIIPEKITAAIYIEANISDGIQAKVAIKQSLTILTQHQQRHPDQLLGMTIAFGADFWKSLNHPNEGTEIKPFTPLGNGLCPATQCDLMIHIQSLNHGINYQLTQEILATFGNSIQIQHEEHGFRMPEERGLDGFIDGTENPHEDDKITSIGTIAQDKPDAGGSYIVLQQYLHDLNKWAKISITEQEQAVGRSKADNIEFARAERLPDSHLNRTNIKENGVGLKIVRRSLPFGKITGEHGLQFIAYCATLHNIDEQLKMMFGEKDGKIDLLLKHLSKVKRSAYYYAPSLERLAHL